MLKKYNKLLLLVFLIFGGGNNIFAAPKAAPSQANQVAIYSNLQPVGNPDKGAAYIQPDLIAKGYNKWITNSCMPNNIYLAGYIELIVTEFFNVGIPSWYAKNMNMLHPLAEGQMVEEYKYGMPTGKMTMRCHIPTDDIKFCYTRSFFGIESTQSACKGDHIVHLRAPTKEAATKFPNLGTHTNGNGGGPVIFLGPPWIRTKVVADNLCVQFWFINGWQTYGCKKMPPPDTQDNASGCFLGNSCFVDAQWGSKSPIALSAVVMNCYTTAIDKLFTTPMQCNNENGFTTNYLINFLSNMKKMVNVVVTLYIMLIALQVVLGHVPQKRDLFIFVIKLSLFYGIIFGVKDGKPILMFIFDRITNISESLGAFFMANIHNSNVGTHLCKYDDLTVAGFTKNNLALWNMIDCRIVYYTSVLLELILKLGVGAAEGGIAGTALGPAGNIGGVIVSLLLNVPTIIYGFFIIGFLIFFISGVVYIAEVYMLSYIILALLVAIGPLMMCFFLFKSTRESFDGWVTNIVGVTVQPALIMVYLPIILAIFDYALYTDCKFISKDYHMPVITVGTQTGVSQPQGMQQGSGPQDLSGVEVPLGPLGGSYLRPIIFYLIDGTTTSKKCEDSWGYRFAPIKSANNNSSGMPVAVAGLFAPVTSFQNFGAVMNPLKNGCLTIIVMGFLFFFFSSMMGEIAGDLTGTISISKATHGTNYVINKTADLTVKAIKGIKNARGKMTKKNDTEVSATDGSGGGEGGGSASRGTPNTSSDSKGGKEEDDGDNKDEGEGEDDD